jgi:hypothetical protein
MNDQEILELAEREPATVETTTKALRSVVDFQKTRGAMLRTYNKPTPSHEDLA